MKKKYLLMLTVALMVSTVLIGGTLAALNITTETGIGAATVDISVKDIGITINKEGIIKSGTEQIKTSPGGTYPCHYNVVNQLKAGSGSAYDVYTKVVMYKSWYSSNGEYMDTQWEGFYPDTLTFSGNYGNDVNYVNLKPGEITENGWLVQYVDREQIILYYTKPISQGKSSTNFLDGIIFSNQMGNNYAGAHYSLEFEVTAVQANNSKDAIAAEFGVFPRFDSDGTIISISEERPSDY